MTLHPRNSPNACRFPAWMPAAMLALLSACRSELRDQHGAMGDASTSGGLPSPMTQPGASYGSVPASPPATRGFAADQIDTYVTLGHLGWSEARRQGTAMQTAVYRLISQPTHANLLEARRLWVEARKAFSLAAVYRIDPAVVGMDAAAERWAEARRRLDAQPVVESQLDYTGDHVPGGIVYDAAAEISVKSLRDRQASRAITGAISGYHVVEFLLWGQETQPDAAGQRPIDDYAGKEPHVARRALLLRVVTDQLVADLKVVSDAWAVDHADNYTARFRRVEGYAAMRHVFGAMNATLQNDLAERYLAAPLRGSDPEAELSRFSDNTHNDLFYMAIGVRNLYLGRTGDFRTRGVNRLVEANDRPLDQRITAQLEIALQDALKLDVPFDQTLLSPQGSPRRQRAATLAASLRELASLLRQGAVKAGTPIPSSP